MNLVLIIAIKKCFFDQNWKPTNPPPLSKNDIYKALLYYFNVVLINIEMMGCEGLFQFPVITGGVVKFA